MAGIEGPGDHRFVCGKDHGVDADAERQGEDRHKGEPRAPAQYAHGIAEILRQAIYEIETAHIAAFFLSQLDGTQRPAGGGVRVSGRHASRQTGFDLLVEVELKFFVQLPLDAVAKE
jgi:hypothetical protein